MNCLQGFQYEESRDKHFEYCKDNETVRIEMPKEGSLVKFQNGQYQFKVPFIMYTNFESILEPMKSPTLKLLISMFPLVSACIESLLMERLKIH